MFLKGSLLIFLNLFLGSVDKGNLGVPQLPGQGCSFHSFRTNTYKLSFMESPSGIKVSKVFVLHILIKEKKSAAH